MEPDTSLQRHFADIGASLQLREWAAGRSAKEAWEECPWYHELFWWARHTPVNDMSESTYQLIRALKLEHEGEYKHIVPFAAKSAAHDKLMCMLIRGVLKQPWEEARGE